MYLRVPQRSKITSMASTDKPKPWSNDKTATKLLAAHNPTWNATVVHVTGPISELDLDEPDSSAAATKSASSASSDKAANAELVHAARVANAVVTQRLQAQIDAAKPLSTQVMLHSAPLAPAGEQLGEDEDSPYSVVVNEWQGSSSFKYGPRPQTWAKWIQVGVDTFPVFFVDAMVQSEEGEVGTADFVGREDVVQAHDVLLQAVLGEVDEPVCLVAGDLAYGSVPDALDFDKAFVAVGKEHYVGVWLYIGRLFG